MAYDGKVRIGTELDESGLEKGLSGVKNIAKGALTAAGALTAGAGVAFAGMAKSALDSVASLEQNVGGVETLFKDSAQAVIDNANNAYKTAGMSANAYMQSVTSFSASLLQSVAGDTEEAAKIADMAMVDMSDNANKMGTDMEAIQNAYQGFAKQNYTMLDNLKLGYGGTKTEMERLLADAEKISGVKYDISNLKDVYSAIHVIQGELGITGTTAKEAATTIEGSMTSAKAAYDNFLNGSGTAEEFADAVITAADNVAKNITEIAPRLIETLPTVISAVAEQIPEMTEALLPPLISAGQELISDFGAQLPSLATGFYEQGLMLVEGLADNIRENTSVMVESGADTLAGFVDGILNQIPELLDAGAESMDELLDAILTALPTMLSAGVELLDELTQGFLDNLPAIIDASVQMISSIVKTILEHLPELLQKGIEILGEISAGMIRAIPKVITAALNLVSNIIDTIKNVDWLELGKNIILGIVDGIKSAAGQFVGSGVQAAKAAVGAVKDFLEIHSPSGLMRKLIGKNMIAGMGLGIKDETPNLEKTSATSAQRAVESMQDAAFRRGNAVVAGAPNPSETSGDGGGEPKLVLEKGSITGEVIMDGEKVGTLVAPTVDMEIERSRRESER